MGRDPEPAALTDALTRGVITLARIYQEAAVTYILGAKSLANLSGVHPDLVRVVKRAITTTAQDFSVHEGLRTLARQKEYVARGVSKTMFSRHLGGFAVDLVPYVDGQLRWEWPAIYPIAAAMRGAAITEGVKLTWGGVWDRLLNELPGDVEGIKIAVANYCKRHPGPDFLDGPHYEIPKGA